MSCLFSLLQCCIGTIKRKSKIRNRQSQINFNSTLVRLKETLASDVLSTSIPFQFHIGAIKSLPNLINHDNQSYFNSTLVRLKGF